MTIWRNATAVLGALFLCACATATKINKLSVGMGKEQVIAALGKPVSVSAQQDVEYLNYRLSETANDAFYGVTTPYYVRIVGGRVESFGRLGDFDSTKDPTVEIKSDSTVHQETKTEVKSKPDLYAELKKLQELRDSGVLTEEEFQAQKKKLLEGH